MADEIRDREALNPDREVLNSDAPRPGELTTADLAGVGQSREHKPDIESADPGIRARNQSDSGANTAASGAGVATVRAKTEEGLGPLFSSDEANKLQSRWDSVQVAFVDEPRQAVEDADRLIATTMKRLAEMFAEERQKLEHQWDRGDNVSTEDLRQALRRYRSFFSRLLKV